MKVEIETVHKIAHLARLHLSETEALEMQDKLAQILSWMEKLREIDTEGVEPLRHMSAEINAWRSDEKALFDFDPLFNSPDKNGSFFRVPRVIE